MKLPYRRNVLISKEKLTKYILSENHATGRFKARVFRSLGFSETTADIFEEALRIIAESEEVKEELSSDYGKKYIIDGKIETPSGKSAKVRTVWILEKDQKRSRLVTVYPL